MEKKLLKFLVISLNFSNFAPKFFNQLNHYENR